MLAITRAAPTSARPRAARCSASSSAGSAADDIRRVVEFVAAERTLPDGVTPELAKRAGGSPLLAEELTRTCSPRRTRDRSVAPHALRLPDGPPGSRLGRAPVAPAGGHDRPRVRPDAAGGRRRDRALRAGLGPGAPRRGARHRPGRHGRLRVSPRPPAGGRPQLAAQGVAARAQPAHRAHAAGELPACRRSRARARRAPSRVRRRDRRRCRPLAAGGHAGARPACARARRPVTSSAACS